MRPAPNARRHRRNRLGLPASGWSSRDSNRRLSAVVAIQQTVTARRRPRAGVLPSSGAVWQRGRGRWLAADKVMIKVGDRRSDSIITAPRNHDTSWRTTRALATCPRTPLFRPRILMRQVHASPRNGRVAGGEILVSAGQRWRASGCFGAGDGDGQTLQAVLWVAGLQHGGRASCRGRPRGARCVRALVGRNRTAARSGPK